MTTLAQIESAMVTTIRDGMTQLRLVDADSGGVRGVLEGRIADVPAAFVFLTREIPVPQTMAFGGLSACQVDIAVALAAASYTSRDDARQDTQVGVYALKDALLALLRGNDLDITGFQGLDYTGTSIVEATETRVIYQVGFRCYTEE